MNVRNILKIKRSDITLKKESKIISKFIINFYRQKKFIAKIVSKIEVL